MFRCHELYNLCTERIIFSQIDFDTAEEQLRSAVSSTSNEVYRRENLELYLGRKGIITIAKNFQKELQKFESYIADELPKGVKNYIERVWLKDNFGFIPTYEIGELYRIKKGIFYEEEAIKQLSQNLGIDFKKNTITYNLDNFLTGTPDIVYKRDDDNIIRDIKISENWETFRNVDQLDKKYFFQVLGYCILTDSIRGYVDYILLENNLDSTYFNDFKNRFNFTEKHKEMEEYIKNLPLSKRKKSFEITEEDIEQNKDFILSRVVKAKEYYNNLNYELAMHF